MQERQQLPILAFILDDNPKVGELVSKLLGMIDVGSRQFVDPSQFLTELKRSHPHLIVLDLALGRSDAVEIIRELDALQFKGKVLLISGRSQGTLAEIEQIGRSHGLHMLQSLQKPFRAIDLKNRLDTSPASSPSQSDDNQPLPVKPVLKLSCLSEALRKNWLEVWYQPKIELRSRAVVGAEGLVRMRHPDRGVIAPESFLPTTGDPLYKPLSGLVLRQAMKDWALLVEYGFPIKLSVNIPASILSAPGFVGVVRQAIPRHPQFPGLIIEITEDEAIRDPRWIHEVIVQLQIYNASISIDDFGSAYASLSRLKDLPFSELKLDREFVRECSSNALKGALCQTVVDLGRRFNVSVCAEGVETIEDVRYLTELGFDTAQGYFFARPMPFGDFVEFLIAQNSGSKLDVESNPTEGVRTRTRA